jgi:hypothetical protein
MVWEDIQVAISQQQEMNLVWNVIVYIRMLLHVSFKWGFKIWFILFFNNACAIYQFWVWFWFLGSVW